MIVRDEADMASGFIEAVRGLWDELIVVDTGSTDDTVERFTAAGATVLRHAWHDDFSEARNVALEACTGDWVLVLDADERVSPEFIREFLDRIDQPQVGALSLRISNALPYGHTRESRVLRAWRRDPAVRFRFAIHEDVSASVAHSLVRTNRTLVALDAPVAHLGYVRARAAAKDKKARDLRLLEACIQSDPFDFYSRLKVLELARFWHDPNLWRAHALAATNAIEEAGRSCLAGQAWAGELIALIAEGLFRKDSTAGLSFLDGWEERLLPSAPFFHQRAIVHEHLGQLALARLDYDKCLTLGDALGDEQLTFVRPQLGLARLAIGEGRVTEALPHATLALERAPRDPEALVAVATLTRAIEGQGALDAWEADHRARLPSCPERDWAIGEALYALGDYKVAIGRLRVAAGVPPDGPAGVRLAQSLLADGQLNQSEQVSRSLAPREAEAGLGVLVFDLLQGKDTSLDLNLTPESANAAMKHWVDALLASKNPKLKQLLRQRATVVSGAFPWLPEYLARRAG